MWVKFILLSSWAKQGSTAEGPVHLSPSTCSHRDPDPFLSHGMLLRIVRVQYMCLWTSSHGVMSIYNLSWNKEILSLQYFFENALWSLSSKSSLKFLSSRKHIMISPQPSNWISGMMKPDFGLWVGQCCLKSTSAGLYVGGLWPQHFLA